MPGQVPEPLERMAKEKEQMASELRKLETDLQRATRDLAAAHRKAPVDHEGGGMDKLVGVPHSQRPEQVAFLVGDPVEVLQPLHHGPPQRISGFISPS